MIESIWSESGGEENVRLDSISQPVIEWLIVNKCYFAFGTREWIKTVDRKIP